MEKNVYEAFGFSGMPESEERKITRVPYKNKGTKISRSSQSTRHKFDPRDGDMSWVETMQNW